MPNVAVVGPRSSGARVLRSTKRRTEARKPPLCSGTLTGSKEQVTGDNDGSQRGEAP